MVGEILRFFVAMVSITSGAATSRPMNRVLTVAGTRSLASSELKITGNTWVGMGKRPRWLQEALAAGSKLEDFLAKPEGEAAPPAAPATKQRGKASSKRSRKTKYRDDAGNVWSGRGPRPRWLKDALAGGKALEDLRS